MSDAFAKITDLKRQLQKTVQEEGGKILQEELKRALEVMPEVEAIVWTQNHNVYNDETYDFRASGFAVMPTKDCAWRDEYIKELADTYGEDPDESILEEPRVYAEANYCLGAVAKTLPEHAFRINFIKDSMKELNHRCPQEVLETFDDVAVRVTRDSITFEDYDYGY